MSIFNSNEIFCKRANKLFGETGQVELSEAIGVTQGTISKIKRHDYKSPSADTVAKIAKYYGVTTDYLLGLSDIKSTDTATREACTALGINDDTVNFLIESHKCNDILKHGIDLLIAQHLNSGHSDRSILLSMAYILSLCEIDEDVAMPILSDGRFPSSSESGLSSEPMLGWGVDRRISLLTADAMRKKSFLDKEIYEMINDAETARFLKRMRHLSPSQQELEIELFFNSVGAYSSRRKDIIPHMRKKESEG